MSSKSTGREPIYEGSLKIAVAREYLSGNLSYGQLARKYGIAKGNTVRHFVRWYQSHYPSGDVAVEEVPASVSQVDSGELEALRKQLKESQLKVAVYETMMSVAQKELGIDISKKFGTKQSGK